MKNVHFIGSFYRAADKLARILPDWITGKSEVMGQKYHRKYGDEDFIPLVRKNKGRTMANYMLIAVFFLIFEFCSFLGQTTAGEEIRSIERPAFGKAVESVPLKVRMKFGNHQLTRDVTVQVKQKALTDEEKLKLIKAYETRLEGLILGENPDRDHVSKPLKLPERDGATGITVNWTSDDPESISESGEVDLIGAGKNRTVTLYAELALDDVSDTRVYTVRLDPDAAAEDYERSMTNRLKESIDGFNEGVASSDIKLPDSLGDGVEAAWFTGKEGGGAIFALIFVMMVLIVYMKRYDRINKEIKEAEESIIRDLPEFINKLVLLLNAGLVVSAAFSKISADYEMLYHEGKAESRRKKRFLYEELLAIQKKTERSNASLIRELQEFSQRCGVREMVRLTAVISDNWNKGSVLAEKLEGEGSLMWITRKKKAEEKGRLAETKLTFPLMILLIVLIMITVAPAMMDM
ncbi:MAG TPA: hypothetical protein PKA19_04525 [Bacillota bacterium]|nr:hypothetical protein [Bacillota bacterium]